MPARKKPLGFKKIGRITVVGETVGGWVCQCDCGTKWVVPGFNLRTGRVKSCGCWNKEKAKMQGTHKKSKSRSYKIWSGIIQRCENKKNPSYRQYGAKGIFVCGPWHRFENFYADMGDPPKGTSIDRIDNKGGYSPENCRWATPIEQGRNTKRNTIIKIGTESKPISEWCEINNIKYDTAMKRLSRGWSLEDCVSREVTP